jgi:hypothetical protein
MTTMDELSDIPSHLQIPKRLIVTTWPRADGGVDAWLGSLILDAHGATQAQAARALIGQIRALAQSWAENDRLRSSTRWQARGALVAVLDALSDEEIRARFVFVPGGSQGRAQPELDKSSSQAAE